MRMMVIGSYEQLTYPDTSGNDQDNYTVADGHRIVCERVRNDNLPVSVRKSL